MDDLLTTRQLQDLLQVDRITIYRMLRDGRLHGFKVGGQWRFPRQEIERWLQGQRVGPSAPSPSAIDHPPDTEPLTRQALPLSCVQAIQDICAEALGVAAVVTGPDGSPLTDISRPTGFCQLILSAPEGRRRCAISWKQLQNAQVHTCHAGLLCASAAIRVNGQAVGLAACCQFTTQPPESQAAVWRNRVSRLAADLSLPEEALRAAVGTVYIMPEDHPRRVSHLLLRVADTLAEIGQERLSLLNRLQHIAQVSKI